MTRDELAAVVELIIEAKDAKITDEIEKTLTRPSQQQKRLEKELKAWREGYKKQQKEIRQLRTRENPIYQKRAENLQVVVNFLEQDIRDARARENKLIMRARQLEEENSQLKTLKGAGLKEKLKQTTEDYYNLKDAALSVLGSEEKGRIPTKYIRKLRKVLSQDGSGEQEEA